MIICCGEALIDMISEPDGATFVPHVGGAVLNTAVALGRLGVPTGLITGLSSDPFGLMIKTALAASRVSTAHAVHNDRNTTLAFVHLENGQATYSFYDDNTATRKITTADLKTLPDDTEAIFFGGISLCNPPVADTLVEMALAQPADKLVMIDPNIRPNFITDKTVYSSRLKSLLVRADIVKLSDDDINWLIEGNASLVEKGHAVLAMGPKLLLLTQGSSGATALIKGRKPVHVAATKVEIIDTVGAVIRLMQRAWLLYGLKTHWAPSVLETLSYEKLTKMLTTANRTAAVTVSRTGANPPWANEL